MSPSARKITRAMPSRSRLRTSHSPPPKLRTKGMPNGQPNWTVLMSSPMVRRASRWLFRRSNVARSQQPLERSFQILSPVVVALGDRPQGGARAVDLFAVSDR